MKIDKIIKKLALKCTAGKWRPTLSGVFFTENKAVATDSHKLVEITYHKEEKVKDKMICKEDIKNNLIDIDKLEEFNGSFPSNYTEFLKKSGNYTEVGVDPQYMIDVMEIYKSAGVTVVHMEVGQELKPIHFSGGDVIKEIEIKGLIMPIKI